MDTPQQRPSIAVLGAGSWGTALGLLLARNGFRVFLWGRDAAHMAQLAHERRNEAYLPGIEFPSHLLIREDLHELCQEARHFVLAVPSAGVRTLLRAIKSSIGDESLFAQATKGMEPGTAKRLSEVAHEELGADARWTVVSGPTFAREVAHGLPTALTVAAVRSADAAAVAEWLRNDRVRVYTTHDVAGVEAGGTVKNVLAIATGISDGLGFGANARAALVTRGLAEMTRLGLAMGGQLETFMGLSGIGDLVLTCTDNTSRNRQVGLAIGRGLKLPEVLAELGQVAEGVNGSREVVALAQRYHIDMPISEQVYRVLFEQVPPHIAVDTLLKRDARPE